jgi:CBS domain-containing protein
MTNSQLLSRDVVAPATDGRPEGEARTGGHPAPLPFTETVTLRPEEPIGRAVRLLVRSRLSALPVVDAGGRLVGLLAEGDLLTRMTTRRRSWWATVWADGKELLAEYRKAKGTRVGEVMSSPPVPVPAGASLQTAADLLARQGLRELPVVAEGRVVGMVTRPAILALDELSSPATRHATDAGLVAEMKNRLQQEPWVTNRGLWVEARDGVLFLTGLVQNEEEQAAVELMARTIPGCMGVDNQTTPKAALHRGWV